MTIVNITCYFITICVVISTFVSFLVSFNKNLDSVRREVTFGTDTSYWWYIIPTIGISKTSKALEFSITFLCFYFYICYTLTKYDENDITDD